MHRNRLINETCKKLFLLLMLLLFPAGVQAGPWNGWVYQNPFPTMDTLLAVKFVTPEIGWVVGERGAILHTESGGDEWEYQDSGTENDLKSVTFVNKQVGWTVGNGGVILYTDDGGKKWTRQGDVKDSLHIVFFSNEKEGWAGGADGTLLHTEDGGKIWQQVDIGSYFDVAGIFFRDKETGWVLSGGRVVRTADGGKSWAVSELPSVALPGRSGPTSIAEHGWTGGVYFFDEKRGLATVGLRFVFRTDDGGITWMATKIPNTVGLFSLIDEKSGCLAGSSILCTKDGGMSWEERLGARPGEQNDINGYMVSIWGISFVDRSTGWGVGNKGQIWKTGDGGKSWQVVSRPYERSYFVNASTGWRLRSSNDNNRREFLYKTDDGGKTWTIQKEFEAKSVDVEFYFSDESTGWVFGEEYAVEHSGGSKLLGLFILHTNDGGKTWTTQFNEPAGDKWGFEDRLADAYFSDRKTGWVVGSNGLILRTINGGDNWSYEQNSEKLYFTAVQFFDNKSGVVIGDGGALENDESRGAILLTDDGGKHWKSVWKKDSVRLNYIFTTQDNKIFVTGTNETGDFYLFSKDRGKTWSEKKLPKGDFAKTYFINERNGIVFGFFGKILQTSDGGQTWKLRTIPIRRQSWHISESFITQHDLKIER